MIALNEFRRNQSQFPREELEKYNGKYVAWSEDGTAILAADSDPMKLHVWLQAAGYDTAEILVSAICIPEEISLGSIQEFTPRP